jgi:hypothetical protein
VAVESGVVIDGSFGDWDGEALFSDPAGDAGAAHVDLRSYSVTRDGPEHFFMVQTASDMFPGFYDQRENQMGLVTSQGRDELLAFVDMDADAATGYQVDGIGADALVELTGAGGEVASSHWYGFDQGAAAHDLSGFTRTGRASCALEGNALEFSFSFMRSAALRDVAPLVSFHMRDPFGNADSSDAVAPMGREVALPAIAVRERLTAPEVIPLGDEPVVLAAVTFRSPGTEATVQSLGLEITGDLDVSYIGALDIHRVGDPELLPEDSPPTASLSGPDIAAAGDAVTAGLPGSLERWGVDASLPNPVGIARGAEVSFIITGTFDRAGLEGRSFGLRLSRQLTHSDAVLTISSDMPPGATGVTSYIGAPPGHIAVDGAFADWDEHLTMTDTDPEGLPGNAADIARYAAAPAPGGVAFMMQVKGTMLDGAKIPYSNSVRTSHLWNDMDDDGVPDHEDPNPQDASDSDGDGWPDDYEVVVSSTDPGNPDTDGDLVVDGQDIAPLDPSIPPVPAGAELPALGADTMQVFIDADGDEGTGLHFRWMRMGMGNGLVLEALGRRGCGQRRLKAGGHHLTRHAGSRREVRVGGRHPHLDEGQRLEQPDEGRVGNAPLRERNARRAREKGRHTQHGRQTGTRRGIRLPGNAWRRGHGREPVVGRWERHQRHTPCATAVGAVPRPVHRRHPAHRSRPCDHAGRHRQRDGGIQHPLGPLLRPPPHRQGLERDRTRSRA